MHLLWHRDVFFRGKLKNFRRKKGKKAKVDVGELPFWCVWKDSAKNRTFLVGKTQNGSKVHFRIIDLTTLNFHVTRVPIDRKLLNANGRYLEVYHLYRDSIINLATLDAGDSLVFLQYDLNSCQTDFHPPIPMIWKEMINEMFARNTVIWGDYFFFVRNVALDSDSRQIYAEVYRYNLAKRGKFRCVSRLPEARNFPGFLTPLAFDAIASDRMGIVLFGVRAAKTYSNSERVALLDVRRMRWTLFPQPRSGKFFPPCSMLERIFLAESGGDMIYVKRTPELEMWRHNIYSRRSALIGKIKACYVDLVHCIAPNNILIVTRESDSFHLLQKSPEGPLSLQKLCANILIRHDLHKPSNAKLKELGINRRFFNMLLNAEM
ncbi:uncharacterized protein LOC129791178 [Lutzomyia longipalpis]|uniref:uncharacterized protein LOC129791178 n=1 Tax=Lutzomyia longipalpis TaxID=7200 RepID=UPI0024838DA2|nr:uncharacterized protein LOC129791178 [Lutzomyia longipalpis]